jgi:hypothetical protein
MQNTMEVALAKIDILEKLRCELFSRQTYLTRNKERSLECLEIAKIIGNYILELKKSPKEWPINASRN